MIKVMIEFFRTMMRLPKPWLAWVGLLVAANMGGSLLFLETLEAKVVLAAVLAGAMIQASIFGAKGFVRLLGIGHILWVPMVPWLWTRLGQVSLDSPFGYWLLSVIVLDSLSLIIDAFDVLRYARGDRTPHLTLTPASDLKKAA